MQATSCSLHLQVVGMAEGYKGLHLSKNIVEEGLDYRSSLQVQKSKYFTFTTIVAACPLQTADTVLFLDSSAAGER